MKIFTKILRHTESYTQESAHKEMELQKTAAEFVPCPAVLDFVSEDDLSILAMERIDGKTIYELYGDDATHVPKMLWKQIYRIVETLYNQGISYIDITSYNFLVKDSKVYIIDFGHAYWNEEKGPNWFLKEFLDGEVSWNPDFA